MNDKLQLIFFISIFLIIYSLLNYFVVYNLTKLFDLSRDISFYLVLLILTISYISASILESNYGNVYTKIVYFAASFWMGFMFILLCLILLFNVIKIFIVFPELKSGIVLLLAGIILSIIGLITARIIRVTNIDIYTNKIKTELRIVHVSDLHIGPINGKEFLKNIVYLINKQHPDYVFITGDLLDGRYRYNKNDFTILKNITGRKYFVTGNHETYAGIDYSMHLIDGLGINILNNESKIVDNLQIFGIDDSEDKKQVIKVMNHLKNVEFNNKELTDSRYKILLYHRPVGFKQAHKHIDLMLSGHTHAGQMFPFSLLSWLDNKYIYGLYNEGNSKLYVSSGAGTWGPPMRIATHSEIALIRLKPINK